MVGNRSEQEGVNSPAAQLKAVRLLSDGQVQMDEVCESMTNDSVGYVSLIGSNLVYPILELVSRLEAREPDRPNEVQTSQAENGLSCAVITLAVFLLESAINRTRYLRIKYGLDEAQPGRFSALNYIVDLVADEDLANDIEEVFTIRDVIAHNHVWEADVKWDDANKLSLATDPILSEGYGDKRFQKVLDQSDRRSRRLRLNLFPPRIWRRDAYLALSMVVEGLAALENIDRRYFYISDQTFEFHGRFLTLQQIIGGLPSYPTVD